MLQTVDVDAIQQWEEAETADVVSAEITAACGLSCYSSSAADAAVEWAEAAAAMTAACGSSFFLSSAADAASAMAADVTNPI